MRSIKGLPEAKWIPCPSVQGQVTRHFTRKISNRVSSGSVLICPTRVDEKDPKKPQRHLTTKARSFHRTEVGTPRKTHSSPQNPATLWENILQSPVQNAGSRDLCRGSQKGMVSKSPASEKKAAKRTWANAHLSAVVGDPPALPTSGSTLARRSCSTLAGSFGRK